MNQPSRSQQAINSLLQLPQFGSSSSAGVPVCAMTGVRVVAVGDPLGVDHGRLSIKFPGAQPFEIDGNAHLKLQKIQSALLE